MTNFIKKIILNTAHKLGITSWMIKTNINRIKRFINPPKIPKNKDNKVFIHLGCGNQNNKKFINIDKDPYPHVHYVWNVKKLNRFKDNYADFIYASHILEHISHTELIPTLKEWNRVLKKNGILRLSVPDFDKLLKTYSSSNNDIETIINPLMGGQDYKNNFHQSVFNYKNLSNFLVESGFYKIREWDPLNNSYDFNDFAKKFKGNLNLEAEKK